MDRRAHQRVPGGWRGRHPGCCVRTEGVASLCSAAQRAPNALLRSKTARISRQVSAGSDAALHFTGRVDVETGNAELNIPFSDLLAGFPLSGRVTVRLVGDAVYADLHALYGLAGTAPSGLEGQRWLRVDDFAIPISTPPLQGLLAAGGPGTVVELLRGAVSCKRVQLRLSAFGVPVGVEAPPPGETLGEPPTVPTTEPVSPVPTAEPE